ncbi:hypothetical protein D516_3305 [Rhodobacter sp. AKP1]|nr:hypothetical protein D516_3305 [Rhodobacter sp. AKP1]
MRLALAGLCLAGWGGLAAMAAEQARRGALAPLGPGMGLIDGLRLWGFGDIRVFMDAASLCSYDPARPIPVMAAEISAMWAAMTLAMLLPLLACRGDWPSGALRFWAGSALAWLAVCALATLAQIAAQAAGLLSPSLRAEHPLAQASFVFAAIWARALANRPRPAPRADTLGDGARATLHGIAHCTPMLLLMVPLGLMNLVAMVAMLALHLSVARARPAPRPLGRVTGLALRLAGSRGLR